MLLGLIAWERILIPGYVSSPGHLSKQASFIHTETLLRKIPSSYIGAKNPALNFMQPWNLEMALFPCLTIEWILLLCSKLVLSYYRHEPEDGDNSV
jgi:hypothetical protein